MSFLDNLENNLKALENQEERDPEKVKRDRDRRDAERNEALLRAPHAEALKKSSFTSELLTACRVIGHGRRVLVRFTWIGEHLRLDANAAKVSDVPNIATAKRLELIPTPEGITAVFSIDGAETGRAAVDPEADDAEALARKWLDAE